MPRPVRAAQDGLAAPRGRPRNPAVEAAVLEAALRQMGRHGYKRMSLDAVAADAGVSKPTIYRRWSGKADLAMAALGRLQSTEPPAAADSAREHVVATLRSFQTTLLKPNGMALIGVVLAEARHTPALVSFFRDRVLKPRRRILRAALERAKESGELRGDADLAAAVHMLLGSYYARYLSGKAVPRDWAERVVEITWRGIEA